MNNALQGVSGLDAGEGEGIVDCRCLGSSGSGVEAQLTIAWRRRCPAGRASHRSQSSKAPPEGTILAARAERCCQVLSQQEEEPAAFKSTHPAPERCLEAGKISELHQEQPFHSNANEGNLINSQFSDDPYITLTMFGTVKNPFKNTVISSVKNAGAPSCTGRPKCHWCSSVANSGAAVSQPFRTPWITSASNAGPIKHSVGRKRNSGEVFMTVEEDDPDRKRQLTELEFVTEVEAGSCSPNLMAN